MGWSMMLFNVFSSSSNEDWSSVKVVVRWGEAGVIGVGSGRVTALGVVG